MLLPVLFGIVLIVGGNATDGYIKTDGGKTIYVVEDEANHFYLNAVFGEAIAGIIIGFLIIYWVFKKYGKEFYYDEDVRPLR